MKKRILLTILVLSVSVICFLYSVQNNEVNKEVTNIEILPIEFNKLNDKCTDLIVKIDSNNSIPLRFDFKVIYDLLEEDNKIWKEGKFYQPFNVKQLEVFNIIICTKYCDLRIDYEDNNYMYNAEEGIQTLISQKICKTEDVEIKGKLILKFNDQEEGPFKFSI